jgi:hypothetical protein
LGIERRRLLKILDMLISQNLVEKVGNGPGTKYVMAMSREDVLASLSHFVRSISKTISQSDDN